MAFSGYRFPPEIILLAVRCYLRFGLSYRDLEELLDERGIEVDHVTLYRWLQRLKPLSVEAARPCRHALGDRWFVDETYVKVAGTWRYVYRAADQNGQVIDVYVSNKRDTTAATRFFSSAITAHVEPVEVTTDKSPVLARTIREQVPGAHHDTTQYANNRIENDHGRLKARLRPMRGLQTDRTASVIIRGHAFIQNLRRGHYELGLDARPGISVAAAFNELTGAVSNPGSAGSRQRRALVQPTQRRRLDCLRACRRCHRLPSGCDQFLPIRLRRRGTSIVNGPVGGPLTTFNWDSSGGLPKLLRQHTATEVIYLIYGPSGQPVQQINGTVPTYLHRDQLGSVRLGTNSAGANVAAKSWDAYGNAKTSSGTVAPLLGYAGQYTDGETGFQYLRARCYDPATGQFLTRDPAVATTQEPYGYAGNNPVNATDPSGLFCVGDLCTDGITDALDAGWDGSGGKVVSAAHDLCFESWQEAATCTAVVAGTVSLGAGGVAVLGLGGGRAGTVGTVSTYATAVGVFSQGLLTADDCSRGVDGSCVVNGISTAAGGVGLGLGWGASYLARASSTLALPFGAYALNAGIFSFGFGLPGLGGYLDRQEC